MTQCVASDLKLEITGQTLSIFSYATNDKLTDLKKPDYWDTVASRLRLWDRILINSLSGGKPHAFTLVVTYASKKSGVKVQLESAAPPGAVQE